MMGAMGHHQTQSFGLAHPTMDLVVECLITIQVKLESVLGSAGNSVGSVFVVFGVSSCVRSSSLALDSHCFLVLVVFFVGIRIGICIGIGKETGGKSTTSLVSLNCWCPTTSSSDPTISSAVLCWFTWFVWWLPRGVRIGYHFTC